MSVVNLLPLISVFTALPLAVYCYVLSRRLRRLNDLETGLGGAIAVMTSEIARLDHGIRVARDEAQKATADLTKALEAARNEKAYWALQSQLTRAMPDAAPRRLKPRQPQRSGTHG